MTRRKLTKEDILFLPNLYNSGLSSWAIAKQFNTCHSNILHHLKTQGLDRRNRSSAAKEGVKAGRIIIKRNYIPKNLKLNGDISYILGVLAGDGCVSYNNFARRYQLCLSVTDKEFMEKFKKSLFDFFKIKPTSEFKKSKIKNWNDQYATRLCSREACEYINHIGNFGKYAWKVPGPIKNSPKKIKCAFIRGFFDSEGNIEKKSKRISATSVNLNGLKEISNLLKDIGIRNTIISEKIPRENRFTKHVVRIQDRKSIELFNKNIGFTIKRKQNILDECIKSYKFTKILSEDLNKLKPKMFGLRRQGLNYAQITKKLNLSLSTVWNSLNVKEATMFPRDRDRLTP
jgi:intein-encoded DNA endonuclease-like protein